MAQLPRRSGLHQLEAVREAQEEISAGADEVGLDSGGYTEIELFGGWRMPARDYVALVRFLRDEVGNLDFALVQDWPVTVVTNRITGLSIKAHQARTLYSYIELVEMAPDVNWVPVLTGWDPHDFILKPQSTPARRLAL